jgi:uncharacterized FlgJ-related protein
MKKFILLFVCVVVACSFVVKNEKKKIVKTPQVATGDTLNIDNLIQTVWALPFRHKNIVIAQAILETGWFKSDNCINNNNLFGMRRSFARISTSDKEINGYAHYTDWKQSVIDYYILQSVRESIIRTTKDQYYRYLDKTYSEVGVSYSTQLKNIIKRLDLPKEWDDIEVKKTPKKTIKKKVGRSN